MGIENQMTKKIKYLKDNTRIFDVLSFMKENDINFIPIVSKDNEKQMVGIVTDIDLINGQKVEKDKLETFFHKKVSEIMITDVDYLEDTISEKKAYEFLISHKRRRCPVLNKNKELVGVLSLNDINVERMK